MSPSSRAVLAALVLCSAAAAQAALHPARAAGPFDGVYSGEGRLSEGSSADCSKTYVRTVKVVDGAFTFDHNVSKKIEAVIGPDGAISENGDNQAVSGGYRQRLTGKATAGALEIDSANEHCGYHLTMKKR